MEIEPPDRTALAMARWTVQSLTEHVFPEQWPDDQVVLLGAGRRTVTPAERTELGTLVDRLPVLG